MITLVGRHRELQLLVAACKDGHGSVVVRGAAGVGKTRLLDAAVAEAELLGSRVLRASFGDLDRNVPYVGLRVALLPILESGASPGKVESIRSALDLELIDAGGDATRDGMAAAFDAGRRLLAEWADNSPVVVALDDVHVADADSIRVIALLIAHLRAEPITFLLTARSSGPDVDSETEASFERLVSEGLAGLVELQELDDAETRALIHSLLETRPDDSLVDAVRRAGRGNPFFVSEAVRALQSDDRLVVDASGAHLADGREPITLSARASLLHRVFELGPSARRLVRVLTAMQQITLSQLDVAAQIAGLSELEVDQAFDTLVAAGVLRHRDDGGFEFTHPIVRATLYADIGPAERRRVHHRLAERLRANRDAGRTVSTGEIAAHVAASAEPGDRESAALLVRAATDTLGSAPLTSARWLAQARSLLGDPGFDPLTAPTPDPLAPGRLLALECRAWYLASRMADAAAIGRLALAELEPGQGRNRIVVVAIHALTTMGHFDEALAVAANEAADGPLAPRVRAARATVLTLTNRLAEARAELDGVLAAADDPASRAAALGALAAEAYARGDLDSCFRYLDDQSALDDVLGPGARLSSLVLRSSYLSLAGLVHDAAPALEEARQRSGAMGGSSYSALLDVAHAAQDWLAGRWDGVTDWSRRIGVDPDRAGAYGSLARIAEMSVATDRGEFSRARELADELATTSVGSSFAAWAVARLDQALGDVDAARGRLESVLAADRVAGRMSSSHLLLTSLVEVCLEAGDAAGAETHCAALQHMARDAPPWFGVLADRSRAIVDADPEAAERSLRAADANGLPVEAARAHLVIGRLTGDESHLRAAHDTFSSLQAEPLLRETIGAMRDVGLPVPRQARHSEGPLTGTEVELARLVHEGLTNRQIARVLFLSPKTVEVYLSRVFVKTGCANRLELALAVSEGRVEVR